MTSGAGLGLDECVGLDIEAQDLIPDGDSRFEISLRPDGDSRFDTEDLVLWIRLERSGLR